MHGNNAVCVFFIVIYLLTKYLQKPQKIFTRSGAAQREEEINDTSN